MKFSSEDLMKAMGLSVGDKVKVKYVDGQFNETFETYEIKQGAGDTYIQSIDDGFIDSLAYLIDQDIEILPRPKRVGDTLCKECISKLGCRECPIQAICKGDWDNATLYKILQYWKESDSFDQEIYDLLKARLDKEVE